MSPGLGVVNHDRWRVEAVGVCGPDLVSANGFKGGAFVECSGVIPPSGQPFLWLRCFDARDVCGIGGAVSLFDQGEPAELAPVLAQKAVPVSPGGFVDDVVNLVVGCQ